MNVAVHGILTEFLKDWALLGRSVNSVPDDFYFWLVKTLSVVGSLLRVL